MDSTEAKEHHDAGHGHDHHDPGFMRKYIFSTDHKIIGIQYGLTSLLFMLVGFFSDRGHAVVDCLPGGTPAGDRDHFEYVHVRNDLTRSGSKHK